MKITFNGIKAYLTRMASSLKKLYKDWIESDTDYAQEWARTQNKHAYKDMHHYGIKPWEKHYLRKHYKDFY